MTVQIDFWQLLVFLVTLIVFLGGLLFGFGKLMLSQHEKHQDERFALNEKRQDERFTAISNEIASLKQLEQRFSDWHFQAIERFVSREDYVRGQTVIEAKLDALYSKHELLQLTVANLKNNKGVIS